MTIEGLFYPKKSPSIAFSVIFLSYQLGILTYIVKFLLKSQIFYANTQ